MPAVQPLGQTVSPADCSGSADFKTAPAYLHLELDCWIPLRRNPKMHGCRSPLLLLPYSTGCTDSAPDKFSAFIIAQLNEGDPLSPGTDAERDALECPKRA